MTEQETIMEEIVEETVITSEEIVSGDYDGDVKFVPGDDEDVQDDRDELSPEELQQLILQQQQQQSQGEYRQAHLTSATTVVSSAHLPNVTASFNGSVTTQQHHIVVPQNMMPANSQPSGVPGQQQQVIILSPAQLQQLIQSIQHQQQSQQQVSQIVTPNSQGVYMQLGASPQVPTVQQVTTVQHKKREPQVQQPQADAEAVDLEELETFAKYFKRRRIELGFTQGDVGVALGKIYGSDFSQTTISRFEALNLSFKNMCKLKPLLEQWLKDAEALQNLHNQGQLPLTMDGHLNTEELKVFPGLSMSSISQASRKRKRRTSIDPQIRQLLETHFDGNRKPTTEQIDAISHTLNMDKEVIRVWFCNRRQKDKRVAIEGAGQLHSQMNQMSMPMMQHNQQQIEIQQVYHRPVQQHPQRTHLQPMTTSGLDLLASHAQLLAAETIEEVEVSTEVQPQTITPAQMVQQPCVEEELIEAADIVIESEVPESQTELLTSPLKEECVPETHEQAAVDRLDPIVTLAA